MTSPIHSAAPLLAPAGIPSETSVSGAAPRKKASTACTACRARRSKIFHVRFNKVQCTGGTPCLSCISHHTDCIKDESEDGRRRIAIKRKLDGLQEDRYLLDQLVEVLKHGSESNVTALVRLVRTNTSRHDLRAFLGQALQDPTTIMAQGVGEQERNYDSTKAKSTRNRPRTGGIGDLINAPIQVCARPWTNVTADDDLVSHLISIWFTWMQPWFRWVEEGPFIEAMRSQDLRNPLCTPYLVNSILAQACLLDEFEANDQNRQHQLRQRFQAEAKNGMDAEQGRASLAMIQAMGVTWTTLYLSGQDRSGRLILNSQLFLAKRSLNEWRIKIGQDAAQPTDWLRNVDRCMTNLKWTSFALHSFDLADYRSFHAMVPPPVPKPGLTHEEAPNSAWSSYPQLRGSQLDFHPDCLFRGFISLAQMSAENEAISANREKGWWEGDRSRSLVQSLRNWPSQLPSCIQLHPQAMPHALILHTVHNWVMLVLSKQAAAAEAGQPTHPQITVTPASRDGPQWQGLSISTAVEIARLMQTYFRDWGLDYFPPMVMQPISLALLTLLEDLETVEAKTAFVDLYKSLQAITRKYRVAKGVLRVVLATARAKGTVLPGEVELMFEEVQGGRRMSDVGLGSEGSSLELEQQSPTELDLTMDYLLKKWQDLDLDINVD